MQKKVEYFSDGADTESCGASCDFCLQGAVGGVPKDMTASAVDIVNCINEMIQLQAKVSLKLTLRGHETKEAVSKGMHAIQHFGKRKGVLQNDKHATSFMDNLIARTFLEENLWSALDQSSVPCITPWEDCIYLLDGTFTFIIPVVFFHFHCLCHFNW